MKTSTIEAEVTTTSLALVIPPLVPKPTKTELVDALVDRAALKHAADSKINSDKKEALSKKIFTLALKRMTKSEKPYQQYIRSSRNTPGVEIAWFVTSPEIEAAIKERDAIPWLGGFERSVIKRKIRESLATQPPSRPNPLLTNPTAIKALDAFVRDLA